MARVRQIIWADLNLDFQLGSFSGCTPEIPGECWQDLVCERSADESRSSPAGRAYAVVRK